MKKILKTILIKLHLLDFFRLLYHSTRSFSTDVLYYESGFRRNGLPDGYPAPPARLIFLIIGIPWASTYYFSGKEVYLEMKQMLARNALAIESFACVLDFGCGCARIIRHFLPFSQTTRLHGSDYNNDLIQWCRQTLLFAQFQNNSLKPPLAYDEAKFDFLYARSVFTHLSFDLQKLWMNEFRRIVKKGGYVYLTTHGEITFSDFPYHQRKMLEKDGILTIRREFEGDNKCSTYQTKKFIEENLLQGFEIIDYEPGQPGMNRRQDAYLLRRI